MLAAGMEGRLVLLLSAAVTLLVLAAGSAATPRKSSQDQYEQQPRDDGRATHTTDGDNMQNHQLYQQQKQQQQLLHRVHLAHTGYQHRFNLLPQSANKQIDNNVPELQVGCAEGSVDVRPDQSHGSLAKQPDDGVDDEVSMEFLKNSIKARHKRQANKPWQRRDDISWYGSYNTNVQPQQPQSYQTYQLSSQLPYYVPIWGNPRRVPVYFPAKPILFNPGYPVKNRPAVNRLAVNQPTGGSPLPGTVTPDGRPITIEPKFGGQPEPEYVDGSPVWGVVKSDPAVAATPPPRRKPAPPLLHRPSVTESTDSSQNVEQTIAQKLQPNFSPPRTTSPPPPPSVTEGPGRSNPAGPDRCVWAIISCCNPQSHEVRYNCFERLGCEGSFWDNSPCSREVVTAALAAAQKYYN